MAWLMVPAGQPVDLAVIRADDGLEAKSVGKLLLYKGA